MDETGISLYAIPGGGLPLAGEGGAMRRAVVLVFVALGLSACSDPLEFADWTIEVPEGIPVREYAGVPRDERTERIELVEDLVIAPTDPEIAFYQPYRMAVDTEHRIYVLDGGKKHIVVFDRDGTFLRKFSGPGQGPGELAGNNRIEVFGNRVVVGDDRNRRLSLWDLSGNLIEDVPFGQLRISLGQPSSDESFVDWIITDRNEDTMEWTLFRYSLELEELNRYMSLRTPTSLKIGDGFTPHDSTARVTFVAERDGPLYVTRGDNYQILAYDPDGRPEWALRVAQEAPLFTREMRQQTLDLYYNPPGVSINDSGWPERLHTIDRLIVDGAGRLWVYQTELFNDVGEDTLLDIYDREGNRLFAGIAPSVYLRAPHDDYFLALVPEPETEEWQVVRYRVVLPFD